MPVESSDQVLWQFVVITGTDNCSERLPERGHDQDFRLQLWNQLFSSPLDKDPSWMSGNQKDPGAAVQSNNPPL